MSDNTQNSELSIEDLRSELESLESSYQNLKFDHYTKGLPNPLDLRAYRRDIARVNTEIRKRELAEMTAEELSNRSKIRSRRRRQKRAN